jgi:LysR family transcriptional regulator for bpeEF and oprC
VAEGANLIARPMGRSRRMIVGSPDYLAQHGEPKTPEDIKEHQCINVLDVRTGRVAEWSFDRDGDIMTLDIPGVIAFNHGGPRVEAAMLGMGIVQALSFQVARPLREGRLKRLLPDWEGDGGPLSILYQRNRHLSAKVRAFVDFVLEMYPPGKPLEPPDAGIPTR